MTATLKQIAEQTSVSVQTVSRILRGKAELHHPQTRQRVLAAAEALNYRPNMLSRALVSGRSQTIGILTHDFGGPIRTMQAQGAIAQARDRGYVTYVADAGRTPAQSRPEHLAVEQFLGRQVEGLIIQRAVPLAQETVDLLQAQRIPVVYIDWAPPEARFHIHIDRETAMRQLAQHLVKLAHRKVTYFASWKSPTAQQAKVSLYQRIFAETGLSCQLFEPGPNEPDPDRSHHDAGYELVRAHLHQLQGTVLVMNNDTMAVGALAALRQAGVEVPGQMSVVGFDDVDAAKFAYPALTTVVAPRREVGEAAFQMLHEAMGNPTIAGEQRRTFRHRLCVRQTTGPAAGDVA